jgi:crotonobetainyl-CoA:carnitine CoA-transferase CaiB-like acyl-CoA transferase
MQHPVIAKLKLSAAPAQFDDEVHRIRRTAPRKGEHSREILEQIGYAADEIDALVESGAVGEG